MPDFRHRLEEFLTQRKQGTAIQQLTPDASTREYFRIGWDGRSAIACVYPEGFTATEQSYLDVTKLLSDADLPVARILDFDEPLGVIVQEDLGDRILRDVIVESDDETRERLILDAISLIPKIQAATSRAVETNSIASRLRFDSEKLLWELDFFKTHYFTTYKNEPLSPADDAALVADFVDLGQELESRAAVLCHRDFHAANLMIDPGNRLRIIDHQDARIGSVAYDLVSLLLDRVTVSPSPDWLATKRAFFLAGRTEAGLPPIDDDLFAEEFRLQTIQRCLKAIGTFSFQSVNRGKTYFVPFISPMFDIVRRATTALGRYPAIQRIVSNEIENG
ncbi:MAG TPA: phosphotransferase [Pyrinomonadaceae bacterium]|nr:phosphotransferase [Pyrinomonadaceae bacterium]